ncbi:hypothetical protein FDENT_13885 [Fusarium denticulatum]|uniref:Uncharacterized protein n=1 Tax=Fusarium denticulatum TaxID=48507 RepID=A0A8H5SV62_9HYPO|nr:hypothetical protein FDENT_13885 [Fusarium denticulatum]
MERQHLALQLGMERGAGRARQGHTLAHAEHYGILTSRFILRDPVDCTDLAEALEARAWSAGEMDRTGTFGGGPGSAPGERRWAKARWEPDDGACMTDDNAQIYVSPSRDDVLVLSMTVQGANKKWEPRSTSRWLG